MLKKEDYYKLAIDARDKLNENYHKWITFYYLAIASILVAVTKFNDDLKTSLIFSIIGIIVSVFWHLSCKGYYYWSNSWIELIIQYEKELIKGKEIGVYSVFSKNVEDNLKNIINPNSYANISTPKLTLLFSYFSIVSWLIYTYYLWFNISNGFHICWKIFVPLFFYGIIFYIYKYILPKKAQSRNLDNNLHNYF